MTLPKWVPSFTTRPRCHIQLLIIHRTIEVARLQQARSRGSWLRHFKHWLLTIRREERKLQMILSSCLWLQEHWASDDNHDWSKFAWWVNCDLELQNHPHCMVGLKLSMNKETISDDGGITIPSIPWFGPLEDARSLHKMPSPSWSKRREETWSGLCEQLLRPLACGWGERTQYVWR